jgi:type I restriction enzyme S subunit
MSEKHPKVLGDYFTLQRGTTYESKLLGLPGPVLLGLGTIQRNGGFRSDSLRTYGGDSPDRLLVKPGELYVSLKDVTQSADLLGAVARLPRDHAPGRLTQDTVKLEPKNANVPVDYLYWLMRTPEYRSYCKGCATGTTNLGLSREDFLSFPAAEPNDVQNLLVGTLDSLDDKIELNRRMNETLEAMARAIFKSWFVDFDPVHAKASGEPPESICRRLGLTPDLLELFPDSFQDSELGEIPAGWDVRSLDSVANFLNGLALQKYPATEDEWLPVIKIAQLRAGHTLGADRADTEIPPAYVIGNGDVLFSWSGSLEVEIWCGGPGALNQHLFKVTSAELPKWFYYLWTRHHLQDFRDIAANKATTMGHIQRKHLTEAKALCPSQELLAAMDAAFEPLLARIVNGRLEANELADLRDTLLPNLLSGSLPAPSAKREAATV